MPDPCLPAIHSAATLRSWAIWRAAHPWWKPAAIAAGCVSAVGLPAAVFYPYAAPPPAIAAPLPLPPPLPSPGGVGQGFYIPPREGSEFSPYLPPSYVPSGEISPIPTGFSPIPGETPAPPAIAPPAIPEATLRSVPPTRTAVPEPASLMALAVGAVGAVLVRRRRG